MQNLEYQENKYLYFSEGNHSPVQASKNLLSQYPNSLISLADLEQIDLKSKFQESDKG